MRDDRKTTILIVDDSPTSCQLLTYILQTEAHFDVLCCVGNGLEAVEFLETAKPDVILMDINMPKMNGFEATRRIMAANPIPIIIYSSEYRSSDISMSFKAIEAGALAILEKPPGVNDPGFEDVVRKYIETIKTVAGVKLVTRVASRELYQSPGLGIKEAVLDRDRLQSVEIVGIGASLGGPQALQKIFSKLKKPFPVPIVLVQHISTGFTDGFVSWLNTESAIHVKVAEAKEHLCPNTIYVAPNELQMEIHVPGQIELVHSKANKLINPSISNLFQSLAETYKSKALGVILTGMGKDGAHELLLMKSKGSVTVAQSAEDCLMFGMPKEAINLHAASHILHLNEIAAFLNQIRIK